MRRPWTLTPARQDTGAVKKPWLATLAVLVFAGYIGVFLPFSPPTFSLANLPAAASAWLTGPSSVDGWHSTTRSTYSWVPKYFGAQAVWNRYWYRTAGSALGPSVVVDALTAPTSGPMTVYPSVSCYKLSVPYVQSPDLTDLGSGVQATLFYANSLQADSPVDAEWLMLTWVWRIPDTGHGEFQRMTLITLDGTLQRAAIPMPAAPGTNGNLRTTFSDILRSTPSPSVPPPSDAAITRLESFARAVVAAQTSAAAKDHATQVIS
jgi:hypothetical protein